MNRWPVLTLALLAAGSAARAQSARPAPTQAQAEAAKQRAADSARAASRSPAPTSSAPTSATPTPATPTPAAPTAVAAITTQPGVQAPTDTAVPLVQTIGWIRSGQRRSGVLENNDFRMSDNTWADVWYFEGIAGQSVVIEVQPRSFDGYVQLLDPFGTRLAEGNHSGSLHDARITFTLSAVGRYQIVVNNEGSDVKTGPYTLSLR